jgi:hypothetical protein
MGMKYIILLAILGMSIGGSNLNYKMKNYNFYEYKNKID